LEAKTNIMVMLWCQSSWEHRSNPPDLLCFSTTG